MSESLSLDTAKQTAADANCDVVIRACDWLMLDLDGVDAVKYFMKRHEPVLQELAERRRILSLIGWESWQSRSGGSFNRHVCIPLSDTLDMPTCLLLQSAMGSDRVRDYLTLVKLWDVDRGVLEQSEISCRMLFRPRTTRVNKRKPQVTVGRQEVLTLFRTLLDDDYVPF